MRLNPVVSYGSVRFVPFVLAALVTLVLAASMPQQDFGQLAAALAFSQVVTSVSLFGLEQLVFQQVISGRSALAKAACVVLISAIGCTAIGVLLTPIVDFVTIFASCMTAALVQYNVIVETHNQRQLRDNSRAMHDLFVRLAWQSGLLVGLVSGGSARAVAIGGLVAAFVSTLGCIWWFGRGSGAFGKSKGRGPSDFLTAFPYGVSPLLYSLSYNIPMLYIAAFGSLEENANARVVLTVYLAVAGVCASVFGEFYRARLYRNRDGPHELRTVWNRVRKAVFIIAPGLSLACLCGGLLIPLVLGQDYSDAGRAILILTVGVGGTGLSASLASYLVVTGHVRLNLVRQAIAAASSLLACLWFPPSALLLGIVLAANDLVGAVLMWAAKRRISG